MEEICAYCTLPIQNGEGYVRFKMVGKLEWRIYHRRRDDDRKFPDCWDKFLCDNPTLKVIETNL